MRFSADVIVVGAGVVGLAIGREFCRLGREPIIIDQGAPGEGVSSRNSGVIHAGIYYQPGSEKAQLCRRGSELLYRYCAEHDVPHTRIGKLIVAPQADELPRLHELLQRGLANGVSDLALLSREDALSLEPALGVVGALHSPSSGIVDPHALVSELVAGIGDGGGSVARHEAVSLGTADDRAWVELASGERIDARLVLNCAGLGAAALARSAGVEVTPQFAKGTYFNLRGPQPFSRLIYPLPEPGGLGIHLTLDRAGNARFGPDVEIVTAPDYSVDEAIAPAFYRAIRRYYPGLPDDSLMPAFAGVRPRIGGTDDFMIVAQGPLIHLLGIDSPGLTAALAIAEKIAAMAMVRG